MTEEEEFEFRARFEAEQTAASSPLKSSAASPGFWDEHPTLKTAMQYGLPIAATAATIPFTGGMSLPMILATEGVASLGAESINQAVGASERDPHQLGLALAAPGVGRALGGVLANIPRLLPGFGEALRGAITPEMRALPGKLFPGNSKAAYQALDEATARQDPHILAFPRLSNAVKELEKDVEEVPWEQLQQKLRLTGQSELFDQIANTLKGAPAKMTQVAPTVGGKPSLPTGLPKQSVQAAPARPPGLSFTEARAASEGINKIIMSTTDPKERGVYQKLRGAILDDIEHAPMPPNGPTELWAAARQAAKNENARVKLAEATERAIKTKEGVDIIDPNHIVKWLRTNNEIKSRVTPQEYRKILNEYRNMAALAGHNMGKFWGMLMGGTAATIAGGAGAGVGGVAGGYIASDYLAKAMMTETGRKWVRAMVGNPSESNFRRGMALLGAEAGAAIGAAKEDE